MINNGNFFMEQQMIVFDMILIWNNISFNNLHLNLIGNINNIWNLKKEYIKERVLHFSKYFKHSIHTGRFL